MVAHTDPDPQAGRAPALPPLRGFLPSTLIDWPGRIAAIVFLPSCNMRCPYCHAGRLLDPKADEEIPFGTVREFLEGKKNWIDGVVICGGEPTLHAALPNLCRAVGDLGFAVKLDTNGTLPEVVQQLIDDRLVDAVSMDVKTVLDARMVELARTDVDLEAIDRSISLLLEAPVEVEFRTTCCPAFVDAEVVRWIARRVAPAPVDGESSEDRPAADYVLQRFEAEHCLDPAFREMTPYTDAEMAALLEAARSVNPRARLRSG